MSLALLTPLIQEWQTLAHTRNRYAADIERIAVHSPVMWEIVQENMRSAKKSQAQVIVTKTAIPVAVSALSQLHTTMHQLLRSSAKESKYSHSYSYTPVLLDWQPWYDLEDTMRQLTHAYAVEAWFVIIRNNSKLYSILANTTQVLQQTSLTTLRVSISEERFTEADIRSIQLHLMWRLLSHTITAVSSTSYDSFRRKILEPWLRTEKGSVMWQTAAKLDLLWKVSPNSMWYTSDVRKEIDAFFTHEARSVSQLQCQQRQLNGHKFDYERAETERIWSNLIRVILLLGVDFVSSFDTLYEEGQWNGVLEYDGWPEVYMLLMSSPSTTQFSMPIDTDCTNTNKCTDASNSAWHKFLQTVWVSTHATVFASSQVSQADSSHSLDPIDDVVQWRRWCLQLTSIAHTPIAMKAFFELLKELLQVNV